MFDRFTDRAKKVMNLARQEAQRCYADERMKVREDWLTAAYRKRRRASRFTPMFVQGGARIASIPAMNPP